MTHLLAFIFFLAQAPADPGPPPEEPGSISPAFIITMIVIFVAFYVFIALPQRREQEAKAKQQETMKKGDKVIAGGCIHGTVTKIEDDVVLVRVAKDVDMTFNRNAVAAAPKPKTNLEKNESSSGGGDKSGNQSKPSGGGGGGGGKKKKK